MKNKVFAYARVSTKEQNLDRQLKAFIDLGIDERDIIVDKESGKDFNRQNYLALRNNMLRMDDILYIKSLDRLSRNKADIKEELEYFKAHNIRLKVLDLPTTLMELPEGQEWIFEMVNNILIEVLGTIAEQERVTIKQRQAEGIAAAKSKGKHLGRPPIEYPANWREVYFYWKSGTITATAAMSMMNLTRSTFYKMLNQYENGKVKL
ncbi:MAG: recombinase family protein [Oscillospiraceae bacterium]|nr:recombinase family protein [Oscillospiraceae bacterium]